MWLNTLPLGLVSPLLAFLSQIPGIGFVCRIDADGESCPIWGGSG